MNKEPLIAKIDDLARIIKLRDQELKKAFQRIANLEQQVKAREDMIVSRERTIRMQDSEIVNLKLDLSEARESLNFWHHTAVCKQTHLDEIKAGKREHP